MKLLIDKLQIYAKAGEMFDLKKILSLYILDILGEVVFSKLFSIQAKGHSKELHAMNDYLLLSGIISELLL